MAEHDKNGSVETTDRGMFDFIKKKDDHEENVAEAEKPKEEKHMSLMDKLHSSHDSHSSSSSDEEEGERGINGEKKKKKKEKKERDDEEQKETVVEGVETNSEEKKGFLDKIKEKLPGHHKEAPSVTTATATHHEGEGEHKGFMDKIKDKIPGYNNKTASDDHDQKEKPKDR